MERRELELCISMDSEKTECLKIGKSQRDNTYVGLSHPIREQTTRKKIFSPDTRFGNLTSKLTLPRERSKRPHFRVEKLEVRENKRHCGRRDLYYSYLKNKQVNEGEIPVGFQSRPRDGFHDKFFVVYLSSSKKVLGYHLKMGMTTSFHIRTNLSFTSTPSLDAS